MQLHLNRNEIAEYAKLKTQFFGNSKFLIVNEEVEASPEFQRYLVLSKKVLTMLRFYKKLKEAKISVYIRVQQWIGRNYSGMQVRGFSPAIGLILG